MVDLEEGDEQLACFLTLTCHLLGLLDGMLDAVGIHMSPCVICEISAAIFLISSSHFS